MEALAPRPAAQPEAGELSAFCSDWTIDEEEEEERERCLSQTKACHVSGSDERCVTEPLAVSQVSHVRVSSTWTPPSENVYVRRSPHVSFR